MGSPFRYGWGYVSWQCSSPIRVRCSSVVSSECRGAPPQGRHTVMIASACVAGDRQKLHAYSCILYGARGKQSLRQAEDRRQSQRLLIDHQTARFHTLDFLREDRGELQPKNLRQLRQRCPHASVHPLYTSSREKGKKCTEWVGHEEGYLVSEMWRPARMQICNLLTLRRTPPKPICG